VAQSRFFQKKSEEGAEHRHAEESKIRVSFAQHPESDRGFGRGFGGLEAVIDRQIIGRDVSRGLAFQKKDGTNCPGIKYKSGHQGTLALGRIVDDEAKNVKEAKCDRGVCWR